MAGQRNRRLMTGMIEGNQLMAEIDGFTPPDVVKVMEEAQGGRFVPEEIMVGLEKMVAELKISGATKELLEAYGVAAGEVVQLDVKVSEEDKEGNIFKVVYSVSGEVNSCSEGEVAMKSKPQHTIKMSVRAYLKTENGKIVYDIDTKTQKINLGKGDIMEAHRRNVDLP